MLSHIINLARAIINFLWPGPNVLLCSRLCAGNDNASVLSFFLSLLRFSVLALKLTCKTSRVCWHRLALRQTTDLMDKHADSTVQINAAFRLACRSPHCHFDDDICTTAQAPLAAEG